jgi:outer membrane receptor protein involved in Fe transport
LRGEYETAAWRVGLSVIAVSSQYARGDDNNQDAHGKLPGYAVANADGTVKISRDTELFGRITNVFDRRYQGFAVLGMNNFGAGGFDGVPEQFRSPAAPRAFFVGLRSRWK